MTAVFIWMLSITIAICMTVISAATHEYVLHLCVTGAVTLAIAVMAVQEHRHLIAGGASRSARAASTSRFIGLIWIWAGCAVLCTYQFILTWRESMTFVIGLMIVGAGCLVLASVFDREATDGKEDETMLGLGRTLNTIQIVGMLIAVIGLVADGKFGAGAQLARRPDWAANNIFFFGALAVALVGAQALISEKKLDQQAQT
jgi:hypothetical protein